MLWKTVFQDRFSGKEGHSFCTVWKIYRRKKILIYTGIVTVNLSWESIAMIKTIQYSEELIFFNITVHLERVLKWFVTILGKSSAQKCWDHGRMGITKKYEGLLLAFIYFINTEVNTEMHIKENAFHKIFNGFAKTLGQGCTRNLHNFMN